MKIKVTTNNGCYGCDNGWSNFDDLIKLQNNNNVITNIICEYEKEEDRWKDPERFNLFIYYEDGTINKLSGNDGYGNGYYGGGFYVNLISIVED
jgi:hypothetical protein